MMVGQVSGWALSSDNAGDGVGGCFVVVDGYIVIIVSGYVNDTGDGHHGRCCWTMLGRGSSLSLSPLVATSTMLMVRWWPSMLVVAGE